MKKREAELAASPAGTEPRPSQAVGAALVPAPQPYTSIGPTSLNGYSETLVAHYDRGGGIAEDYRSLRTNLLAQYPDERCCVLITSAEANEGKTVTCLNLALILAERQERKTLVVDADLRKCTVATLLNAKNEPGLADLLRGAIRLEDAIKTTAYGNLFVLTAGKASRTDMGELLHRPELEELVNQVRQRYDYVLFDTPPITVTSDAGALGRAVHEAILVVRMNKTHRETADSAIRLLHAANVKPVGVVLTHHKYYIPKFIYYRT
jgi:capsular exopolysaccharide synthesis family protein